MKTERAIVTNRDKEVIDRVVNPNEIYVTVAKASASTGLTKDEIYKMCREGKIKSLRPNGKKTGKIYTKISWINAHLENLLLKEETRSENPYEGIVIIK